VDALGSMLPTLNESLPSSGSRSACRSTRYRPTTPMDTIAVEGDRRRRASESTGRIARQTADDGGQHRPLSVVILTPRWRGILLEPLDPQCGMVLARCRALNANAPRLALGCEPFVQQMYPRSDSAQPRLATHWESIACAKSPCTRRRPLSPSF